MEWKSLKEFPNYQFSDTGLVKKGETYHRIYLHNRYPYVTLSNEFVRKQIAIHKIVAELFIGPCPEGQLVRHLDDNRENNHVSNLTYGTYSDNTQDAIRNGKIRRGDDHWSILNPEKVVKGDNHWSRVNPEKVAKGDGHWARINPSKSNFAKLTQAEVNEIRTTKSYYGCIKTLAKKFNVHCTTISRIRNGKLWCNSLL